MKLITVDTEKCTSCNKCMIVCPVKVIKIADNGIPYSTNKAFELCINCGYCVDICVYDALFHKVRKRSSNGRAALKRYEIWEKKGDKNEK